MSKPTNRATNARPPARDGAGGSRPIRVLYVDDSPFDRALVRDALLREHDGFELSEVGSRAEFGVQLRPGAYDIVLSDFNILGFEGLQVLDAVQEMDPALPVVIVTGTGSEEVAVEAMKRGAADYVLKTTRHIRRLPHTLHAILEARRLGLDQKRVEGALQKAGQEWQSTFDAVTDVIWVLDEDHRIRRSNKATASHFGCDAESVVGRHCWEIVHNSTEPLPQCPVRRMKRTLRRESTEFTVGERCMGRSGDGQKVSLFCGIVDGALLLGIGAGVLSPGGG